MFFYIFKFHFVRFVFFYLVYISGLLYRFYLKFYYLYYLIFMELSSINIFLKKEEKLCNVATYTLVAYWIRVGLGSHPTKLTVLSN